MTIVAEDAVGAVADEVHVAASRSTPLYNRDDTPHTDRRAARAVHSGGRKFVHPNWTPQGILCCCVVLCCVYCDHRGDYGVRLGPQFVDFDHRGDYGVRLGPQFVDFVCIVTRHRAQHWRCRH